MKRAQLFLKAIKTVLVLSVISIIGFFLIAMKTNQKMADVWSQLGISVPQAHQNINNSFIYGKLQYLGAKNAKDILLGNREAVVKQLVEYAKKYWKSDELKTAYNKFRNGAKPEGPVRMPVTAESIKAEEKLRLEKALKTAEEGLNSTNPKIKNGAPLRIENVKKELAALDDPNNATIKRRLADADRSYEYASKQQGTALQKFEMEYPEDPQQLLKRRLEEILTITQDVDYSAELKEVKGIKLFVNPDYEKKPAGWKLAFRAGKETTEAVRKAAEEWLKELK